MATISYATIQASSTISEDIRIDLNTIARGNADALAAFREMASKARNCLLKTKSLSKANMCVAGLKEIKDKKFLSLFREKFLVYCGYYDISTINDRSILTYHFDPEWQPIKYDIKQNSFYEYGECGLMTWSSHGPTELPLDLLKISKPKKEKKVSKEQELLAENENLKAENARLKAEIKTLLASKGKGKGNGKKMVNADALIEAIG